MKTENRNCGGLCMKKSINKLFANSKHSVALLFFQSIIEIIPFNAQRRDCASFSKPLSKSKISICFSVSSANFV